jgi:glycosyltransferase involved in cell wall biosynthesis
VKAPARCAGRSSIRSIGVVVPARDEAELLPACLRALTAAARHSPVPVSTVVVADSCSDSTAGVSATFDGVHVVTTRVGRVGAARGIGFEAALHRCLDMTDACDIDTVWLATTDGDSVVSEDWFVRQLAHEAHGADVVAGTVRVTDWAADQHRVAAEYDRRYNYADGHRHVHGANLSMRAQAYLDVNGFAPLASHEDVELVGRLQRAGWQITWAGDLPVQTSARADGRAPDGFARYVRELA